MSHFTHRKLDKPIGHLRHEILCSVTGERVGLRERAEEAEFFCRVIPSRPLWCCACNQATKRVKLDGKVKEAAV